MKLLVTGAWHASETDLNALRALGHEVIWMQNEKAALPCDPACIEGAICNGLFLSHPIEAFINLRYIQLTSAGFDRVPMDYVKAHNIEIHNARGVYSIPMAEFAVCGVLQLMKQSRFFMKNQQERRWEKHRNLVELFGKTVCIVGCGSVGTECAKRFSAFGCEVTGVDLYPREDSAYVRMSALADLNRELARADVVVLTLPLTDETKHLMNAERFSHMKQGAILVNIARGAVIDTDALLTALTAQLSGAVLDVFEEEPLPSASALWDRENVIVTPHNSFVGDGNNERMFKVIFDNIRKDAN